MLWVNLHIVFIASWFAGLPRISPVPAMVPPQHC
jgi:uncharacterized membrane protein